jgi:hypothetical protein
MKALAMLHRNLPLLLATYAWSLLLLPSFAPARPPILRVLATAHYRIETDLASELSDDLAQRMDAMYDEYTRRFSQVVQLRPAKPLQVYLFRSRADYLHLVGPRYLNTGGLYVCNRNFLAAFLEGQGRDTLRRTLQHEAFHQFVHEALPDEMPVWLNEGMAQIYEEGLWTGHEFWTGQVPPRRIRQLQLDLKNGRILSFRALAEMSPEQWAQVFTGDRAKGATQYNQAWAIVYFLMHFRDAAGHEPYRPRLISLFQSVQDGTDSMAAFTRIFPDAAAIDGQFLAYAKALQPTADATLIENQGVLADLLVALHAHQALPGSLAQIRNILRTEGYRMHYTREEVKWDSDPEVAVYFADASGRPFTRRELTLERRRGAPIPDLVCRCFEHYQLRTRFLESGGKVEHEVVIEATR